MTQNTSTKQVAPYGLRMPQELKERVQAAADANGLSMNALICQALEKEFPPLRDFDAIIQKYDGIRKKLEQTTDMDKKIKLGIELSNAFAEIADYIESKD